jgi:uncharacterized 2Fe-2S/4Fe-4S cluster protein (DUF4445 family)
MGLAFRLMAAPDTAHGRDIVVTTSDVNEIQLAKGAIRTGAELLMAEAGVSTLDVDQVVLAGAFGTYLDVTSALTVGLLPCVDPSLIKQVGNAAGLGARQLLVSRTARSRADELGEQIKYIELTGHRAFTDTFVTMLSLGDTDGFDEP